MQIIKIDLSGVGGLIPSSTKSQENLVYFGADNQMQSGYYNPFVYPGYLSPLRTTRRDMSQTTNTALNVTCLYDANTGKFMSGSQNGYINYWSSPDTTSGSTTIDVAGSRSLGIYDFEVYQLNGSRMIFFTSFSTPNGFVGVTDGTTFTSNWSNGATSSLYTGTVSGSGTFAIPPILRLASNGFLYIIEGNRVHKIDGTTSGGAAGTITANVLTVNATQQITDAADWRNNMYFAVQEINGVSVLPDTNVYSTNCGIYIWDRVSTQIGTRDYIPLSGIKRINRVFVAHDGKLRIICTTADNRVQLREFTGSYFEPIFELNSQAAPVWWDALFVNGYGTFWAANDQTIYCHGKPGFGFPNALYKAGKIIGTVTNGNVGYLYYVSTGEASGDEAYFTCAVDSGSTPNSRITKVLFNHSGAIPANFSGGSYVDDTIVKTRVIDLPFLSNILKLNVFFAPVTSTGTQNRGSIRVYINNATTPFKSQLVTMNDLNKGYITIPLNKQYINKIQIGVDWTTAASDTTTGITNEMMPYYATLEYEGTKTYK